MAVSGGGDSISLLLLLADWARTGGYPPPIVLTVDHGLRPDSARDAADVAARARGWNLQAHVLRWGARKPSSDIEGAAREARYRLTGEWCCTNGVCCLYVAHTIEDQAETFLLRLARGSGVDGLAAMKVVSPFPSPGCESLRLARPLLGVARNRLRAFLSARQEFWLEDPMNCDPRFARARLRTMWPMLEEAGLTAKRIADAARHLGRARSALDHDVVALMAKASRVKGGNVLLDAHVLASVPEEIGLRALARALMQVSGRVYGPRFERLERLLAAIAVGALGKGRTLHGCMVRDATRREACFGPHTLRISLEPPRRRRPA
ncbi:MAG TPA: tRNA lysidine(34) synthetase TilS [Rhizomicrobium sp.]|nr:tRNA lysidine(34) synthetase TilS [Rhizomicrobium sp.]